MDNKSKVIYKVVTDLDQYEVVDEIYTGRPARILYGGKLKTAQSGIPLDTKPSLLFGYNRRLYELIRNIKPAKILAIGGGVYTLPTHVVNNSEDISFDVVEPDGKLDDIALKYFQFKPSHRINIIHDYGLHYLTKNHKKYDLILIDAYGDHKIPDEILTKKFAKLASKALKPNGLVVANVISDLADDSTISQMHNSYKKYFSYAKVYPTGTDRTYYYPHNLIYTAFNQQVKIKVRYPELTGLSFF